MARLQPPTSRKALAELHLDAGCSLALLIRADRDLPTAETRAKVRELLRRVIGRLTAQAPETVAIAISAAGKPYLKGDRWPAFSLSHGRTYSLIALSESGEIGCDIEDRFDGKGGAADLVHSILHPEELQQWSGLPAQEQDDAFKRYWVRKEAVLKAAGTGFLKDPRSLIVGLDTPQAAWPFDPAMNLNLHMRRLADDCFAAIASFDANCAWHVLDA